MKNAWSIKELLDRLQTRDECSHIEVKESKNALGRSVRETISAFSNEPDLGGGYLVLGLRQNSDHDNKRYTLTGVKDPDKLQCELASACREEFSVRIFPEIQVEFVDGVAIVAAFIPESFARDKPVFIKKLGIEQGAYRRIGPADFRCTEEDFDLLYQLRRQCRYESEILPSVSYEDLSQDAIEEYRKLRFLVEPQASELKLNQEQLLLSLGVGVRNREGQILPTIAGLLLFGKREALKRVMPACRVDYIIVEGIKWLSNGSERYKFAVEYWEPLITLMPRLHSEIMNDLPMKFELNPGELQRSDIPLIPREVVREAIANLLMHRDYRVPQPTQIIRYSNRIEFKNAGYSLKPLEELLLDSGSIQRNQTIAKIFHDLKFAETKGTGICSMREQLKSVGFTTPPIIETDRDRNQFDLILFPHHLLDESTIQWLLRFKDYHLNDAERRALAFVKNVGAISNEDYRQVNGVDTLSASRGLSHLKELGILLMKGKGSSTYYLLSEEDASMNSESKGSTPYINPLYKGLEALPKGFPTLPKDLEHQIMNLQKRSSRKEVKKIIKELCSLGPLQPSQLGQILDRDAQYLRIYFLSKMAKDGELVYEYPDQPAHPKQAYKTPSEVMG